MVHDDLSGKVIVITGASSGFGKGAALKFAEEGAFLVLAARRDDLLDELVEDCERRGGKSMAVPMDVSLSDEVTQLAVQTVGEYGRIDVWINNAGVGAIGKFQDLPLEDHEQVIRTNLLGTLYGSYEAFRVFFEQGDGILINIASELGRHTVPYYSSYAASKHGVVALGETLNEELKVNKVEHIHVCTVMPTAHDTPFFDHVANYTGHRVEAPKPLHDPENVVDAIVRLAHDPKDEKIVGGDGIVKVLLKRLAPSVAESLGAKQMQKTQITDAPAGDDTDGAVQDPVPLGTEVSVGRRQKKSR